MFALMLAIASMPENAEPELIDTAMEFWPTDESGERLVPDSDEIIDLDDLSLVEQDAIIAKLVIEQTRDDKYRVIAVEDRDVRNERKRAYGPVALANWWSDFDPMGNVFTSGADAWAGQRVVRRK
jgi:hypothetical protein